MGGVREQETGAGRMGARAAAVGAAVGVAALVPAGVAHAGIISVGNATFGNTCINKGGSAAQGATTAAPGVGTGNALALPLHISRNNCGSSGIICTL